MREEYLKSDDPPELSVIVVVYDMEREAPRTLQSLAPAYQVGADSGEYEVVVVENGSSRPLDDDMVCRLGPNMRYFSISDPSPSPAGAVNFGVSRARGRYVGVMVDGARMVTPGMIGSALDCLRGFSRVVVGSLGFHLGREPQYRAVRKGYDREAEDRLLAGIDWPSDGYRLFDIACFADSSRWGWSALPAESNCFFMSRELFLETGGYETAFDLPGGGLVNLDFWKRACELPSTKLIILLGEGSFHQVHGGSATGRTEAELQECLRRWGDQYAQIRGRTFVKPSRQPQLFGALHPAALPWIRKSFDPPGDSY